MTWEITFTDGPFQVRVTSAGTASPEGFKRLLHEMTSDPRFRHDMNVLADHSALDPSAATPDAIRTIAAEAARVSELRTGYTAIVVSSDALFGLGRMWEAYVGDSATARMRVVRSVDEAYTWLESVAPAIR